MLNPPIDLLTETETEAVVAILRASADLAAADRQLRLKFPHWDMAKRVAGLRQAQNVIFRQWEKRPARKRREALVRGHSGEAHKEGRPESAT